MSSLPPEQLKILQRSYLHEYTHLEIAGMLNIPPGTVKSRMRLGLEKMRGLLLLEAA